MAKTKIEKPVKGVKYEEIKPHASVNLSRVQYMKMWEIYQTIRPYLDRELPEISKKEFISKYPNDKKLAEDLWICIYELKLKEIYEIAVRIIAE